MPRDPFATPETSNPQTVIADPSFDSQHGPAHQEPIQPDHGRSASSAGRLRISSPSRSPGPLPRNSSSGSSHVQQLKDKLSGLSPAGDTKGSRCSNLIDKSKKFFPIPAQRIVDYENALTPPVSRQGLGVGVVEPYAGASGGILLTDMPNEILVIILLHLHPDYHGTVALVSKRFYVLTTTPHIWRLAFSRHFPGHANLRDEFVKASWDVVRSETRYFSRLTPLATWRSEYVFRTRLIRSLAKGKPNTITGAIGSSVRANSLGKKSNAVLTYNSKLPWLITNIHAVFENGKRPPRAVQGSSILGLATMSDPTTGKIESWGLKDRYFSRHAEFVMQGLTLYGLGDGPAATDNSMDVSQLFGIIAGEGHPGGRPYFRGIIEITGRYLGSEPEPQERQPDIPRIPQITEGISSVWIAKSFAVPATTSSMCGMLVGSTLGVITAYSLGSDPDGPRYAHGDMTARWALSPGVPIVSIKVDDNYTVRRKLSRRIWAVALNALGEVFYLTKVPKPVPTQQSANNALVDAWRAGRSVYWHLIEETRRSASLTELQMGATHGTYSPRSSTNTMNLDEVQIATETNEIEKYMSYQPNYFRNVCAAWDMRRKLEVDFARDDGKGAGEGIFVIDCGHDQQARIIRYCRSITAEEAQNLAVAKSAPSVTPLFGLESNSKPLSPGQPPSHSAKSPPDLSDEWHAVNLELKVPETVVITASALDNCDYATLTLSEDPKNTDNLAHDFKDIDFEGEIKEIPGNRARFLAVGTEYGGILVWNAREESRHTVLPCRIIQTDSPSISCVAVSSLYLVHGGSDGLVQAWDPLASTLEPIRTLNARSNGRATRYLRAMNPTLHAASYVSVGAIFLDSDPTVLRGVAASGAFMRYWSYRSRGGSTGRKRRVSHADTQGRAASRRFRNKVSGFIVEEEEELRHEDENRAREQTHLRKRFGVGALGDLTEQEALEYMQMVSEETFLADEARRASDSTTSATGGDRSSSTASDSSADAMMPETSFAESSPPQPDPAMDDEDEFEKQMQQAIRLSLLESASEGGQPASSQRSSSDEFTFAITYKAKVKSGGKGGGSERQSSSTTTNFGPSSTTLSDAVEKPASSGGDVSGLSRYGFAAASVCVADADADLALAVSLSLQQEEEEQADRKRRGRASNPIPKTDQDFPPLDGGRAAGKGKGVARW